MRFWILMYSCNHLNAKVLVFSAWVRHAAIAHAVFSSSLTPMFLAACWAGHRHLCPWSALVCSLKQPLATAGVSAGGASGFRAFGSKGPTRPWLGDLRSMLKTSSLRAVLMHRTT